jgi:hypothetical protein
VVGQSIIKDSLWRLNAPATNRGVMIPESVCLRQMEET